MLRSKPRGSALLRFVYARCGADRVTVPRGAALAARWVSQDSWPAVISPDDTGALPAHLLKALPTLAELKELCGHHQARASQSSDESATTACSAFDAGLKGFPPEALRDVMDELATESAPKHYAASVPLERDLPEFAERLRPLREADWLWRGRKLIRLFPPSSSGFLKPLGGWYAAASCWMSGVVPAVYSPVDAFNLPSGTPDPLDIHLSGGEAFVPCQKPNGRAGPCRQRRWSQGDRPLQPLQPDTAPSTT
eukprot:g27146.t1